MSRSQRRAMIDREEPKLPLVRQCALLGISRSSLYVGNQQKWDTFVKERSGGNGSVVGLPEQVVVAFAAG